MTNPDRTTFAAALAVVGLLAAGCTADLPESSPETTESTQTSSAEAAAETETVESESVDDDVQDEATVQAEPPNTEFTVGHTADGRHGLEVSVHFNLQGSVEESEGNVVQAVARAVEEQPDYDLIVVRGYIRGSDPATDSPTIEAWYMPKNVETLDLENPAQADAYEHCYSCYAFRQHNS